MGLGPNASMTALSGRDIISAGIALGAVATGLVLAEAAVVPGIVIGGAAWLAPKGLNALRRQLFQSQPGKARGKASPKRFPVELKLTNALVKTITYRVVFVTVDFSGNYLILGELTTAAGLSGLSLVAGPLFYFLHEVWWNYLRRGPNAGDAADTASSRMAARLRKNPALFKTISYRVFATIAEFGTNYAIVGELPTALLLSSVGFFAGPVVYYLHEIAWERYENKADIGEPPVRLISYQPGLSS